MAGKKSAEKTVSGKLKGILHVSGWCVSFHSVEEAGSAKSIFRDLIHQPQKNVQTYVIRFQNQNIYYPAYIFEEPTGSGDLRENAFLFREIPINISPLAFGKNYADKAPENYRPSTYNYMQCTDSL